MCMDWVPRSSRHLFHRFSWPKCHPNGRSKCGKQLRGEQCIETCRNLLETSSRISSAIQELRLTSHSCPADFSLGNDLFPEPAVISLPTLFAILALLPCLRALRILDRQPVSPTAFDPSEWKLPHDLDIIEIEHAGPDLQETCNLLAAFEHTTSLSVSWLPDGAPRSRRPVPVAERERSLKLEALSLSHHGFVHSGMADYTIRSLPIAVESLSSLHTLRLGQLLIPSLLPLLTPIAGPNLKRFGYVAHPNVSAAELAPSLHLEALEIGAQVDIFSQDVRWEIVLRDLALFDHTSLQEITLEFYTIGQFTRHAENLKRALRCVPLFDWAALESTLSGCTSLQVLRFRLVTAYRGIREEPEFRTIRERVGEEAGRTLSPVFMEKFQICDGPAEKSVHRPYTWPPR